jgi:hypothetical protein
MPSAPARDVVAMRARRYRCREPRAAPPSATLGSCRALSLILRLFYAVSRYFRWPLFAMLGFAAAIFGQPSAFRDADIADARRWLSRLFIFQLFFASRHAFRCRQPPHIATLLFSLSFRRYCRPPIRFQLHLRQMTSLMADISPGCCRHIFASRYSFSRRLIFFDTLLLTPLPVSQAADIFAMPRLFERHCRHCHFR